MKQAGKVILKKRYFPKSPVIKFFRNSPESFFQPRVIATNENHLQNLNTICTNLYQKKKFNNTFFESNDISFIFSSLYFRNFKTRQSKKVTDLSLKKKKKVADFSLGFSSNFSGFLSNFSFFPVFLLDGKTKPIKKNLSEGIF